MQIDTSLSRVEELTAVLKASYAKKDWATVADAARLIDRHLSFIREVASGIIDAMPKKKERPSSFKKQPGASRPGDMTRLVRKHIDGMKPSDVRIIPFEGHEPRRLQATASGVCNADWGNATYLTAITDSGVEILRVK